jgi:hypothetical protein
MAGQIDRREFLARCTLHVKFSISGAEGNASYRLFTLSGNDNSQHRRFDLPELRAVRVPPLCETLLAFAMAEPAAT